MKRLSTLLLIALAALLIPVLQARASLRDYGFQVTTGSNIDIGTGIPILMGPNEGDNDRVSRSYDMGFTFYLDGKGYNSFTVSDNGGIGLGTTPVSGCWVNYLTTESGLCDGFITGYDYTLFQTPHICPWWDDLVTNAGGGISYSIVGNAPNRILVVDYRGMSTDYYGFGNIVNSSWQARLYETTNKIEFYYSHMDGTYFADGGSIGMATSGSNFISVSGYFDYESLTGYFYNSSDGVDDYVPLQDPEWFGYQMIPNGTMFVFNPCQIQFSSNMEQGGTEAMNPGDTLLANIQQMRYTSGEFTPFGMYLDGGCGKHSFTAKISGPAAGDYQIDPSEGTVVPVGEKGSEEVVPTIIFTPSSVGPRYALLTITDELNRSTEFMLGGVGLPRVSYTPDTAQGGSIKMANHDILMRYIRVRRGQTGSFTPFTLTNISEDGQAPPAQITYSIMGLSGGQYSISPSSAALHAGETSTPTITFSPTGVGYITDSLIVNAEGEIRTFALSATSVAAGATLSYDNQSLTSATALFRNVYDCLGEGNASIPIVVRNIGIGPFEINGIDIYKIDTTYKTGQPPYPILYDGAGNPIRMNDYVLTDLPYKPGMTVQYPLTVDEGTAKTIYLTFVGSEPGKRFGRAFVSTNGENFSDANINGTSTQGMLSFEVYARGTASSLSDNPDGKLPRPVVFPPTGIGASTDLLIPIFNPGQCALRISTEKLKIYSGDVSEFTILSTPSGSKVDPLNNDILIKSGDSASVWVRFTPSQIGSRRATMAMVTNDSAIELPGHSVRGIYYLDLYGVGGTGLYASSVDLGMALIGGGTADNGHGAVRLVNNASTMTRIVSAEIVGVDSVDFTMDGNWPALPLVVMPGQIMDLGLTFAPATGTSGARSARLKLTTSNGDILWADLSGTAGTRAIAVDKTTLTFASITTAKQSHQSLMISNTGSLPLTLTTPQLSGTDAADFSLSSLPRTVLQPGQNEMLEITFTPTTSGKSSSATLTIGSNAPAGSVTVPINGQALKTIDLGGNPDASATTGKGHDGQLSSGENLSVSGVDGDVMINGMTLHQSVPNPAHDLVTIGYSLATRGDVVLSLYDGNGRLVQMLDRGAREIGEHTIQVNVSGLASGVYHYRLVANGKVLDRSLRVIK